MGADVKSVCCNCIRALVVEVLAQMVHVVKKHFVRSQQVERDWITCNLIHLVKKQVVQFFV